VNETARTSNGNIILGIIHLLIGLGTISLRYFVDADIIQTMISTIALLPLAGLFAVVVLKCIYGIGGVFPGTSLVLLYFLGRECSASQLLPVLAVIWLAVLLGISISYALGTTAGRVSPPSTPSQLRWYDLIWLAHPNLVTTYFFENGHAKSPFMIRFIVFAICGWVLICIYASLVCIFKPFISSETKDIGMLWGCFLVGLGLWRIMRERFL
jgi:membrane protein DedA with SNARE-associated domain